MWGLEPSKRAVHNRTHQKFCDVIWKVPVVLKNMSIVGLCIFLNAHFRTGRGMWWTFRDTPITTVNLENLSNRMHHPQLTSIFMGGINHQICARGFWHCAILTLLSAEFLRGNSGFQPLNSVKIRRCVRPNGHRRKWATGAFFGDDEEELHRVALYLVKKSTVLFQRMTHQLY